MKEYTTETGVYVLHDSDGRVIAKADVPPGTHPVPDEADLRRAVELADPSGLHDYPDPEVVP